MSDTILVGYATRYGSTREVAKVVATALEETGPGVDLLPLRDVRSLEKYRSVVIGAPLYMFHWHRDALAFLSRFHGDLAARAVAVFALGPFHDKEDEWQEVRRELSAELAKTAWLTPVAQTVFGGKFDPAGLKFPFSWIPAMKKMPASDARNWDVIREWAAGLSSKL
jgi:menaquinone-dependent protoporphyrinogen oxidase